MSTITLPAQTAAKQLKDKTDELFDGQEYQLPIPRLDGTKADKLELKFAGTIALDPTDEADLALISSLLLDQDVTLRVEAAIAAKAFKIARSEDETTATHTVTAKVHTLYRDAPAGT